jgi:hypothetical protein
MNPVLSLKNDLNTALKSNKQKNIEKFIFLVAILKVTDENSKIRIQSSEVRIRGSGSIPKCQGSEYWPAGFETKLNAHEIL